MIRQQNISFIILLSCIVVMFWSQHASGDLIFLKDGTQEESERVWETEAYVHFILKGTKTVEVRFAKEFVDHIERTSDKQKTSPEPVEPQPEVSSKTSPSHADLIQKKSEPEKDKRIFFQLSFDEKIVKENKGISFYKPHRSKRYWATRRTRYNNLQEALLNLAKMYGRSVEWVRQNMGEDNDLGLIHENLMRKLDMEAQSQEGDPSKTAQEAPQSHPPAALQKKDLNEPDNQKNSNREISYSEIIHRESSEDPHFYDPRKEKKYWISPSEGFDTLNEALTALAQVYHVSVDWIEEHMGDSNRIEDIHQNIRRSLADD